MRLQHLLRDIRRLREIERDEAAGRITSWQADRETFEVRENDEIYVGTLAGGEGKHPPVHDEQLDLAAPELMKRDRGKTYVLKRYWCVQRQNGEWFLNHGDLILRWSTKRQAWLYTISPFENIVHADQGLPWNKRARETFSKTPKAAWTVARRTVRALLRSYRKTLRELEAQLPTIETARSSASSRRTGSTRTRPKEPTERPSAPSSPSTA